MIPLRRRTLVALPLRGLELERTVGLARHPRAPLPQAVRVFLQLVRRYAR
ncbi:MAG: hypothetical protein ACT4TC_02635 [Myxococcaceae bacterium]